MNAVSDKNVVVVGGGIAGLCVALEVAKRGGKVTVLEREDKVGGLARSFHYGDSTFDLGPHRFHTDDMEVERYITDILGRHVTTIERSSAVWLYNNYHDWPLTRASLLKLPPLVMAQSFADLFRRPPARDESLEAYIRAQYGDTLFEIFFRPYTEKFLKYKCHELHRDWASVGINRAVIDKRVRFDSLWQVAKTTLMPPKIKTRFLYPTSGGIARFVDMVSEQIESLGGRVVTGAEVEGLHIRDGAITRVKARGCDPLEADVVLWTAALPTLVGFLGKGPVDLRFLAEVFLNFTINHPSPLPYQWTYYGGAALSFSRASSPARFHPGNSPPGKSGVCVEVVCVEGDDVWQDPSRLQRDLVHDMVRVRLARDRDAVEDMHVERVKEAYPIYTLDYQEHLAEAFDAVLEINNVALLGRSGHFWYNNMDHSVRQALDLAQALDEGQEPCQWNKGLRHRRAL